MCSGLLCVCLPWSRSEFFTSLHSLRKILYLNRGNVYTKGTVSWDGFAFWWNVWLVLGLNRGLGHFLLFSCMLQWFYNAKSVFLAINARLRWLNNVSSVYVVQVSFDSYWSAGFGTLLQVSALASHWLEDYANCTPMLEENDKYSSHHF